MLFRNCGLFNRTKSFFTGFDGIYKINREAFKNSYLLFLLALLWGPSFLFIKIAVAEIAPVTLAALRIGIAAVLLNVFLAFSGGGWTRSFKLWKHLIIVGFLAHGLPFILINWGEQYIDSALASILNGLTPVFTIVLANFMMKDDKMNLEKVIGTGLGFVGLLILILPNITGQIQATTLGIVAVSIAAFCYGAANLSGRSDGSQRRRRVNPRSASRSSEAKCRDRSCDANPVHSEIPC